MAALLRSFHKNGTRMTHRLNKKTTSMAAVVSSKRNMAMKMNNIHNNNNNNNNNNKSNNNMIKNSKNSNKLTNNNKRFFSYYYNADSNPYGNMYHADNGKGVPIRSTTIICVRKDDEVVLMGDGQMTIGSTVAKPNARKLRKLNNNRVICGFAGAAADGISLVDLLEKKLSERDELRRACVETTKLWRTDKILRHLNALIIVADDKSTFELTGSGELVESDTGIIAIGSGGHYAEAAARALMDTDMTAEQIAEKAMKIAGDMCVYTNHNTMKLKIVKGQGIIE